jgi:hypothetical protein
MLTMVGEMGSGSYLASAKLLGQSEALKLICVSIHFGAAPPYEQERLLPPLDAGS